MRLRICLPKRKTVSAAQFQKCHVWTAFRIQNNICKTKDNVLAQYATSAVNVPVGISEYELNNLIPDDYKSSMPTIEEIERELKD